MADVFEAVCFAAAAPGSRPCRVRVEPGHLAIEMEGEAGPAVRWPYERIDCAPGGEEQGWLMVACPEAADDRVSRLVAREPALLAALAARVPEPCRAAIAGFHGHRRGHALRRHGGLVAFAIAAALVALIGWLLLTRVLPGAVARSLPPATEAALGRALVQQLLDDGEPIEAGPAVDAVRAITARLVAAVEPATGHAFEVHVLRDPLVNALALPGGQIVVYTGLLAEAGSAEEVAGVLAHEIQHVLHRDALRRLVGQLGGWALVGLLTGGGDLGAIAARAGDVVQLSYGRDQEREADRDGLRLLARAGLPPAAMPAFFERLGRREGAGLPEWLSTHPDTGRRIGALRALAVETPVAAPRPLGIDWEAVQASLE